VETGPGPIRVWEQYTEHEQKRILFCEDENNQYNGPELDSSSSICTNEPSDLSILSNSSSTLSVEKSDKAHWEKLVLNSTIDNGWSFRWALMGGKIKKQEILGSVLITSGGQLDELNIKYNAMITDSASQNQAASGQTIDLDQIVKTRHPLLNKKAKWKLNDIFNLEKIEAPIYLSSLSERTLTDITNQENNHIVPTHIQKFNQELSKLDNYTKDKDINSLYVIVLTFFEEIGQRYNLESVADDFPCLSFVIDFHDPYGKLDSLYRKYFGINYKDIEIYQSYDIFHVNKHLDKYIKESIEKDLLAIPDDYGGLDKIYFELAERSRIKKTHFKTKKDTLMDEGTWMKLTIDAFFYSMIKFFDDNLG
ncbi:6986_t:CDS:10, partial [Entrophospora sp. SA101]